MSNIKKISPTQAKILSELCKETFVIPHGHSAPTKEIERYLKNNFSDKHVLDMGCGTGVLAILAELKGATEIHAIDIDRWCYINSKENIERNWLTR